MPHGACSCGYSACVSELHLIWFTLEATALLRTRAQVNALARDLGMDVRSERSSARTLFEQICARVLITYDSDNGQDQHTIRAVLTEHKPDFSTVDLLREDQLRVGQVKYFVSRRTSEGIVHGSSILKPMVRRHLRHAEQVATQAWIDEATHQIQNDEALMSPVMFRRLVLEELAQTATPIRRRGTMFFAYADQLTSTRAVTALIHGTVPDPDAVIVPVDAGADYTMFAESADEHLDRRSGALLGQVTVAGTRRTTITKLLNEYSDIVQWHNTHVTRLGLPLPRTFAALHRTKQVMLEQTPTIRLPPVTRR